MLKIKDNIKKQKSIIILSFLISFCYFILINILTGGAKTIFIHNTLFKRIILTGLIIIDFFILSFIIYMIFYILKNRYKHKKFIKHFILYFSIMLIFLILLWPGIFKGDEFYILRTIENLKFCYSQHYITSLFYMLSLCFFPTPGAITFFQILIISIIIAYILSNIERKIKCKKLIYLFYLIFLLPPVIDNNLFTLRSSLISYLFLLMIFHLIRYNYDEDNKFLYYASIISIIIACWKSDMIYLPILILIYVIIFYRKKFKFKKIIIGTIFSGILFQLISLPQMNPDNYIFTAVINPLSMLVKDYDLDSKLNRNDKETIEKIISLENLKEAADYQNISAYFVYIDQESIKQSDKTNFLHAYANIIINYPLEFLNVRLKTYLATNNSSKDEKPNHTGEECPQAQWELDHFWYYKFSDKYKYTNGILNSEEKKMIISNLLMRHQSDYTPNKLNHFFYNVTPVSITTILLMLILFFQKRYKEFFLCLLIITQLFIVFLTAPASFWMYYVCLYINLNFIIMYFLVNFIDKKRLKRGWSKIK